MGNKKPYEPIAVNLGKARIFIQQPCIRASARCDYKSGRGDS
jgi:hypothetical protein